MIHTSSKETLLVSKDKSAEMRVSVAPGLHAKGVGGIRMHRRTAEQPLTVFCGAVAYLLQTRTWPVASAGSTTHRALTVLQASQDRRSVAVLCLAAGSEEDEAAAAPEPSAPPMVIETMLGSVWT